jgi:hypothetical protein
MVGTENLKEWEKLYLEVAFHIDKYLIEKYQVPFVESYYGPTKFKEIMDQQPKLPLSELTKKSKELYTLVENTRLEEPRNSYLLKHITAMQTSIDVLSGLKLGYLEEVNRYFDITPGMVDESVFQTAINKLNEIMTREELLAHRKAQNIPKEKLISTANLIMNNLQSAIQEKIELPAEESFQVNIVSNKPWGAYNWYLGNYSSKIELNVDINYNLFSLLYLIAHEGYTGHHLEHCMNEHLFFREKGYIEHSLMLTRGPESLISEGIAEMGLHVLFPEKKLFEWIAEFIAPHLGLTIDPELEYQIFQAGYMLRYLRDNCAILLHVNNYTEEKVITYYSKYLILSKDEAKMALAFIMHPYWKVYSFNYGEGLKLVKNYLGNPPNFQKFLILLTSQILPSQLY